MSDTGTFADGNVKATAQIRVAFFLPDLMGGGAEKVMSLLASGLAERGFRVDFVLLKARGVHLQTLSTKVQVLDLDSTNAYVGLPRLIGYLRRHHPSVILSSLNLTNLTALLAVRLAGTQTRSIIRLANTISSQRRAPWKKYLERILVSWIYPWADEIIAVSHTVARDMVEYANIQSSKIHVIYNPVLHINPVPEMRRSVIHPWLEDTDIPVILGIGRLTAQKDFKTLLEAFALLRRKRNARLIILGEGELRHDLEVLADDLDVRLDVDLPGYVTDTLHYMQRANVFVLSSAWEGLPNVLIEALGCGCQIVSTDCPGGVQEILADGKYGTLVPVGDPPSMADAIQLALSGRAKDIDPEWLDRFSFDRIMRQVIELVIRGSTEDKR